MDDEINRSAQLPLGFVTFVATKVTKNACQQKGFFAARAFALQIRQNLGCNIFARASPAHARASSKICYALQPHRPPSFSLISAEAALLTEKNIYI